ncbi:MAG: UDP-N-acetylglucosamine 1-carboxyvinyltransferase [Nitrospirota bacterium]
MDKILINGGKRLKGEVRISGAKNAALPILVSSLLSREEDVLSNIPSLVDVKTVCRLLSQIGAGIKTENGKISVISKDINSCEAPYDLVKTMRASVLSLGPLVSRFGEARVSLPGGCAIGARPVNLHLTGFKKMGAFVKIEHGYINLKADRLKGARIYLDIPSVTATENLMMAAVLADGVTTIENAACEPEIADLAEFLIKKGARIKGTGSEEIIIEGVSELHGAEHRIIPDRIEAGTFIIAAAITGGDVLIMDCIPEHLEALIIKLKEAGIEIKEEDDRIKIRSSKRHDAVDIKTMYYPGFPTDMQAQMMTLMSIAEGASVITETIFESRFNHAGELRRMGADIKIHGNSAIIKGVSGLSGAPVMASDLRASASLIIAGLAAEGTTEISRIYHLDRGYEHIEEKLSLLGADIKRVRELRS